MSLDLGELVTRIGMDLAPLRRDKEVAKTQLRGVVSDSEAAGQDAGEGFAHNWGDSAKKGAVAAGAAFGIAVVAGLHGAMDREAASAKMAVQLGLTPEQQARMGALAGRLYAQAYGDSIDDVNESLVSAKSSLDGLDGHGLRRAARDALNFQSAFGTETGRSIQVVGQLIDQHLIKNPQQGFDLLFRSTQKIPAAVREDLLDASDEYGQFFSTLGFDGRQAFQVLVNESAKGMYGLDKAGDAIKEFTIRSTDMSTTTKQAYATIGLDARTMADDILAGGDRAHDATQKIIQGLLDIEDPSKRANTALKLFGTPLEDLGVKDIPKFLKGLQDTGHQLDDVKGSAGRANRALSDTADADFTKLKRRLQNDLIGVMDKALPLIEDDLVPALEGIGDALDNVPSWAIKGGVGGLLGLIAAGKLGNLASSLRSLRGGVGSIGGSIASKAAPVPVFVTNQGFGTDVPGVGPSGPEGEKPLSKAARLAQYGGYATTAAFIGYGLYEGQKDVRNNARNWAMTGPAGQPRGGSSAPSQVDAVTRLQVQLAGADQASAGATHLLESFLALPTKVQTLVAVEGDDLSKRKVKGLIEQYDLTPSQMKTLFDSAGIPNSIREVQNLIAQQGKVPSQVSTAFHMNGIEAALGQIATLESRIDGLKGRGDHVLPYVHGGQTGGGSPSGRVPVHVSLGKDVTSYIDTRARGQIDAQADWEDSLG